MAEQQQNNWGALLSTPAQASPGPQTPRPSETPTAVEQPTTSVSAVDQPTTSAPAGASSQGATTPTNSGLTGLSSASAPTGEADTGNADSTSTAPNEASGDSGYTETPLVEAVGEPKGEYMPEVQLLSVPEVDMAEYNRRVNQYNMLPGESAYDMVMRNTPKPKTLDAKDEKRQKLFAALGDIGLLISDAVTVGKGGLIPKRGSAIASTMKSIEAEKARDAKALAEYNKLLREAMVSDSKTKTELSLKGLAAGQAYLDEIARAKRSAEQFNVSQQNLAARAEVSARAAADRLERNIETKIQLLEYKNNNGGNRSGDNSDKYVIRISGVVYKYPKNAKNFLQDLARKAIEEDAAYVKTHPDAQDVATAEYTAYLNSISVDEGLSDSEAYSIIRSSRFFTTEAGANFAASQISNYNNNNQ